MIAAAQVFWAAYVASLPEDQKPENVTVEASPAGHRDITDDLIRLYREGRKTAGSSLVEDFQAAGEALPKAGNYWIVLDSQDRPVCIAKTIRTAQSAFRDVAMDVVLAEGEGDLTLEYWRAEHARLWEPHLPRWGIHDLEQATVITEFFEIVWPVPFINSPVA